MWAVGVAPAPPERCSIFIEDACGGPLPIPILLRIVRFLGFEVGMGELRTTFGTIEKGIWIWYLICFWMASHMS